MHPVTVVMLIAYLGWVTIYPTAAGLDLSPYSVSYRVGAFLGSLLVAAFVAGIGWLVAGRSSWVGNVLLCVLFALYATGAVLVDLRETARQRDREAVAKINTFAQELGAEISAQAESDAVPDTLGDFQNRMNRLESAFAGASENDARAGKAIVTFLHELEPVVAEYDVALKKLMESGGADMSGIDSLQSLQDRVRVFELLRDANQDLMDGYAKMPTRVAEILIGDGVARAEAESQARSISRNRSFTVQRLIRESDRDIADAGLAMLAVLREHWGTWSVEEETGQIILADDSQVEAYQAALQKLQDAGERQSKLMQEMADSLRKRGTR